jgi:hypothetical protein
MGKTRLVAPLIILCAGALSACGPQSGAPEVRFRDQVVPVLKKHCGECHTGGGAGTQKTGFAIDSHSTVMKGTKYGPVVVPGSAVSSSLYRLVAGKVDPSIRMPHGREQLSASEIALIETWIDQGAKDN